jgi:heme oxygenase
MTTTDRRSTDTTFSELVRSRTMGDHGRAQSSGFMADLMDGRLSQVSYAELVAQLFFVYSALEAAAETMREDVVAGAFVSDDLRRGPALAADLQCLIGEGWEQQIAPSPATAGYCDRIDEVCSSWPGGFVAHHYTRYLGDLSGGQVIGAVVRRAYQLPRDAGAAFYEFPEIADRNAFKDRYRARLDDAPWDAAEQERIVDEIMVAYAHNVALLAALDGLEGGSDAIDLR